MDSGEPIPGMTPQEVVKPKPQSTEGAGAVGSGATSKAEPKPEIDQIKKELTDPRTISKKLDPEGRSETAKTILEARVSARSTKEGIAGNEQKYKKLQN